MLKELKATQPLPVRILRKAFEHSLIGEVEGVLEIRQPNHQPGGFIDLHATGVTSGGVNHREDVRDGRQRLRPTQLTSEQMEERHLTAATLLRQGQLSQADIARHVEVSRASV